MMNLLGVDWVSGRLGVWSRALPVIPSVTLSFGSERARVASATRSVLSSGRALVNSLTVAT